jgi:hypothetical protein
MPSHKNIFRALKAADIEAQVIELIRNGHTFREVAKELAISVGYAHKVYVRALDRIPEPGVSEYRAQQLARIQLERQALLDILADHHVTVSNGHVVSEIIGKHPETTDDGEPHPQAGQPIYGEALTDPGPVMQAVDRLIKLDDQEARLLNLYPAQKIDATAHVTYSVVGVEAGDVV